MKWRWKASYHTEFLWELSEIMTLKWLVNYEVFCSQEGMLLSQGGVQTCEDHPHPETHFWGVIKLGCCLRSFSLENLYLARQWLGEKVRPMCTSVGEQSPWSHCSFFPFYPNLWHHFPCWLSLMDFSSWFHLLKRLGKNSIIVCSKTRVSRIGFIYS